jgi:hypothetical protein
MIYYQSRPEKMKKSIIIIFLFIATTVSAQTDTVSNWTKEGKISVNANQNYFSIGRQEAKAHTVLSENLLSKQITRKIKIRGQTGLIWLWVTP